MRNHFLLLPLSFPEYNRRNYNIMRLLWNALILCETVFTLLKAIEELFYDNPFISIKQQTARSSLSRF